MHFLHSLHVQPLALSQRCVNSCSIILQMAVLIQNCVRLHDFMKALIQRHHVGLLIICLQGPGPGWCPPAWAGRHRHGLRPPRLQPAPDTDPARPPLHPLRRLRRCSGKDSNIFFLSLSLSPSLMKLIKFQYPENKAI